MDIEAFWSVVGDIAALPMYDTELANESAPVMSDGVPTQEMLDEMTAAVIDLEQRLALIPGILDRLDDLGSGLNYHFDPSYAGSDLSFERSRADPTAIRTAYDDATAKLIAVRSSVNGQAQVLQALLSTYTAARAKIEHDLGWQEYVRSNFGVEPGDIPRKSRDFRLDLTRIAA